MPHFTYPFVFVLKVPEGLAADFFDGLPVEQKKSKVKRLIFQPPEPERMAKSVRGLKKRIVKMEDKIQAKKKKIKAKEKKAQKRRRVSNRVDQEDEESSDIESSDEDDDEDLDGDNSQSPPSEDEDQARVLGEDGEDEDDDDDDQHDGNVAPRYKTRYTIRDSDFLAITTQ